MQRVTVTLEDELLAEVDRMVAERGYQNRSEAIRDLARTGIRQAAEDAGAPRDCVAALVYVYDHEARNLSKRLTQSFHDHHDLSLTALHVHLDHTSCLEVAVLRGKATEVRHFGDHIVAERGVRYGRLVTIPVDMDLQTHAHGGEAKHRHLHAHVRNAG